MTRGFFQAHACDMTPMRVENTTPKKCVKRYFRKCWHSFCCTVLNLYAFYRQPAKADPGTGLPGI